MYYKNNREKVSNSNSYWTSSEKERRIWIEIYKDVLVNKTNY